MLVQPFFSCVQDVALVCRDLELSITCFCRLCGTGWRVWAPYLFFFLVMSSPFYVSPLLKLLSFFWQKPSSLSSMKNCVSNMALTDFFSFLFCDWMTPSCLSILEFILPLYNKVCVYIYTCTHIYTFMYIYRYKKLFWVLSINYVWLIISSLKELREGT